MRSFSSRSRICPVSHGNILKRFYYFLYITTSHIETLEEKKKTTILRRNCIGKFPNCTCPDCTFQQILAGHWKVCTSLLSQSASWCRTVYHEFSLRMQFYDFVFRPLYIFTSLSSLSLSGVVPVFAWPILFIISVMHFPSELITARYNGWHLKHRTCIKFCMKLCRSATEILEMLLQASELHAGFKPGRVSV